MAGENAKIDQNFKGSILGVNESGEIKQVKIEDLTDRLLVSATTSVSPPTTIVDNRKVIATAGTRLQLIAASTPCKSVVVQALVTNGKIVAVGGVTVVAAEGSEKGFMLQPGQAVEINISNVNKLYIDARTAGNGVSFFYTN